MDKFDPNEWTPKFVRNEPEFCMELLRQINATVIEVVREKNYAPAVAGLDRILNGLITILKAGGNVKPHLCMFSWMEAEIIAFGIDAPEEKCRRTAIALYEDARDFAKSENTKNDISQMISALRSRTPLSVLRQERGGDLAEEVAEILEDLQEKLVA